MLLIAATVAAYYNSFQGAFVFDDEFHIVDNWRIRQLWPPSAVLGRTDRPVPQFSFAVNYALGGLDPWGYHLANLAAHVGAGLLLFGIVRRTLEGDNLRGRYGQAAPWLAAAVAALWLIHPLQTHSVTYIVQRDETLMGLFFLLTLYCGIRGSRSPHRYVWYIAAIVASALGMATKQVMATAPIVMLIYDRIFLSKSFNEVFRERWGLYLGLAGTWIVLLALMASLGIEQLTGFAGEREQATPLEYAQTQPRVIVHYLRLAFWPHPLVFDYRWPLARTMPAIAPWAVILLAILAATLLSFRRWPWIGFLGVCFFLILAPTSTILPIADAAVEHRMYLPLAAVVVLIVIGGYELLETALHRPAIPDELRRSVQLFLLIVTIAALGYGTAQRNEDYRSNLSLWGDTVAKIPDNFRAHYNLGIALDKARRVDDAIVHFSEATRLKPDYAPAHINLGLCLVKRGRIAEAIAHYNEALQLKPDDAIAHNSLGSALAQEGKLEEAVAQYTEAARIKPSYAPAQNNWGAALYRQGKVDEAIAHFGTALRLDPAYAEAHNNLGAALGSQGKFGEAVTHFADAVRIDPEFTEARDNLRKAETLASHATQAR